MGCASRHRHLPCTPSLGRYRYLPTTACLSPDLSATTSHSQVELSEVPGPGSYTTITANGPQPLSPKRTLPTHRFCSSTRESSQRAYVSPEHARAQIGHTGPDAGLYTTVTAMGDQPLSGKSNQPAFTWAREDRLRQSYEKAANVRRARRVALS